MWPDYSQERNALIPHRHDHDNLSDAWQSLLSAFSADLPRMHAGDNEPTCFKMHADDNET